MTIKQRLPVQVRGNGKRYGEGYVTPRTLDTEQEFFFPPERVIPVIFLPGIMGSNLRMTRERQTRLKKKNNIAWRPDRPSEAIHTGELSARERQLQLDPKATVVDEYDPKTNPTGDDNESADERHRTYVPLYLSPAMMEDPFTATPRKSAAQKGRERGWGEVYLSRPSRSQKS